MSDDLTIVVGNMEITGWEEIEVTLRAEAFPNNFSIALTTQHPVETIARAGAPCAVHLGSDLVITGYIDRDVQSYADGAHRIGLVGRGRTQDLVDCSGEWPSSQKTDVDVLQIAQTLVRPYIGLSVELGMGAAAGPAVPQWLLNYGESGAEIIQRCARNAHLLAYEDPRGVLILGALGSATAASGVVYGQNVQAFQVENSMDGRFSEIVCARLATDSLQELGGDDFYDHALDPNVPRHRLIYSVLEATGADEPYKFAGDKARWDAARRAGRSAVVTVTVDSWRDRAGVLWAPNTLVPVQLPGNRGGSPLILAEVTFRRSNETGTTAELTLMPKEAFVPEPISLNPVSLADATALPAT